MCVFLNVLCPPADLTSACPQVPGYTLLAHQDHEGDDIECSQLSHNDASIRCSDDPGCQGFNTFYNDSNSAAYACTKTIALPTTPNARVCSYVKQ